MLEQTQKTRVQSKQFSGDWSDTISPQGNTGNATAPAVSHTRAFDLSPLAKGIENTTDTFVQISKEKKAAEKEAKKAYNARGKGELLLKMREINELIPDGSKREEAKRKLLEQGIAEYDLDDNDVQSLLKNTGSSWEDSAQGKLEEYIRQDAVESRKKLADLADKTSPSMMTRPFEERVEKGREVAKAMNEIEFSTDVIFDPNGDPQQKALAMNKIVSTSAYVVPEEVVNRWIADPGSFSQEDAVVLSNTLSSSWIGQGRDPMVARVASEQYARNLYTKLNGLKEDMLKASNEEKEAMLKNMSLSAKQRVVSMLDAPPDIKPGMSEEQINEAVKEANNRQHLALMYMLHDYKEDEIWQFKNELGKIDMSKYGFNNGVRYWIGDFDVNTATAGINHGKPLTAVAAIQGTADEAFRRGDARSIDGLKQGLMADNTKDIFKRVPQGPAQENAKKVILGTEQKLLEQAIVNYVLPTTAYGEQGQVKDLGFWETKESINNIIQETRERLQHYGSTDEDQIAVVDGALKSLGIERHNVMTNPEELYKYAEEKFQDYYSKHWFKWMLDRSGLDFFVDPGSDAIGQGALISNYKKLKDGEITEQEFTERTVAGLKRIAEPGENPVRSLEDRVLESQEFRDEFARIQADNSMDIDKKSEVANDKFKQMLQNISKLEKGKNDKMTPVPKETFWNRPNEPLGNRPIVDYVKDFGNELFGVKSAGAQELSSIHQEISEEMADKMLSFAADMEKFIGHVYDDNVVGGKHIGDDDIKGNATLGYGKNISTNPLTKEQLDYIMYDGKKLTQEQKDGELGKELMKKAGDMDRETLKKITIDEEGARKILVMEMSKSWNYCKQFIPGFENLDPDAQLVCADIAYNAGPGFFTQRTADKKKRVHQRFMDHLEKKEYKSAAWVLSKLKIAKTHKDRIGKHIETLMNIDS